MFPVDCVVRVGPVNVGLRTDVPALLDYLSEFYDIERGVSGPVSWTVDAAVGSGAGLPPPNRWGVAHQADVASRSVVVRSSDPTSLSITVRKAIREALIEHCEQRRYVMVHASAFSDDERVIMVVGDKGSGKTTLALRAMLDHRFRLLSNDHLLLFAEPGPEPLAERLQLTSLPTPIPVKIGTYLDLESRLHRPWDDEGIDLEAFRAMPRAVRYTHRDDRVMFTYRGLGQANPVEQHLGAAGAGPRVVVVLASYAAAGGAPSHPEPVARTETALWPHVRFDWVFNPDLNTHYLPRRQRSRDAYGADARRVLVALASRAEVISWAHHGDPSPLLAAVETSRSQRCVR